MRQEIADRIRGAIYAMACANSLGGTSLGMSRKEIMFSVGIKGVRDYTPGLKKSLLPEYEPGSLLADTLMALEVAQSLIEHKGHYDGADIKLRFSKMLTNTDFLAGNPGAHCLLPLRRLADNLPPCDGGEADSAHVAAAVRAVTIGCIPNDAEILHAATAQARLVSHDKRVSAAAAVLASSVAAFIRGQRIDTGDEVRQYVAEQYEIAHKIDPRFAEAWEDIAPDLDYLNPADDLPYSLINVDSHVNESVPTAVGIFLIFRHDLEEAVTAAASSGGDTDTVAAIVGALSGAYHGESAIPDRWLKRISDRDLLDRVADGLIALWK